MSRRTLYRNISVTCFSLILATLVSYGFFLLSRNTTNVAIFYILATILVARNTEGYVPGIVASLFSVACINYVFTYPYMVLNFSLDGYPITFFGMLLISSITSTLTTHLKEQTRILKEREQMLMEAEKEKVRANLLRAVSHDLRTPLTGIIGASANYIEHNATMEEAEKTQLIHNIYEDAVWLLHMVENLLSITRINNTTASVKTTLEPLEEVIPATIQRFHKRLPNAHVKVQIPDEFIMVPMDATLIQQVLINLLENAFYHSGSDKPIELNITVDSQYAVFHVRDYGHGIAAQNLDTIFDGYTPDESHSSDSHKGMGIGLSICKTIINAHHGTIIANNHSDGAEFIFTLPLGETTHEPKTNRRSH